LEINFKNFEIHISKFLFRKKSTNYFRKFENIYFSKLKQIFFSKKKFFKFSQQKNNLENIFIFENLDTNLFKNLGKFRFFFENFIPIFFLQRVIDLRIFKN